ncbi:MAG: hypothetical protein WCG27_03545, partial [Pseudomonadota bacterium]
LFCPDGHKPTDIRKMERASQGIWELTINRSEYPQCDLSKCYYQYEVSAYGQTHVALDPYARSMASFDPLGIDRVGKASLAPLPVKKMFLDERPSFANSLDFIAAEAHVRDFTIDPSLKWDESLRGTYPGFAKMSDYFRDLGVTHIQFMPLQNFYTVKENDRAFVDQNAPRENINYNWGYDPHNYFSPEGWFSSNAADSALRIKEMREMIQKIHNSGMGVTLDIVYNHLYDKTIMENVAPGGYLRRNDFGEISLGTGAGVTLESRILMARKLIIDSMKWWYEFYGVDGFRFDLMGFLDHQTMLEIRKALGPKAILYGEAWNFTDLPADIATTKNNFPEEADLAVFNDSSRDAYTGNMASRGFVQGNFYEAPNVKAAIIGALADYPSPYGEMATDAYKRFARKPSETLNYLAIHDGYTLWDKINLSIHASKEERLKMAKQAFALLLTSQGRAVIHGGDEMGRSKPLAPNDPNPGRAHTSDQVTPENGISYFHENTYKSPDISNQIDWQRGKEFSQLTDYVRGLIKLRRSLPGLRFEEKISINRGLKFLGIPENKMLKTVGEYAGYSSFTDPKLKKLTIEFINAPGEVRGKTLSVAGEIHAKGTDKNPLDNPYKVEIDGDGRGQIKFSREQINSFDLSGWADNQQLQIKLVKKAGAWEVPEGAYSPTGNNTIAPGGILLGDRAVIDLAIIDHTASNIPRLPTHFIAYEIDNTLESAMPPNWKKTPYQKIIILHNASDKDFSLPIEALGEGLSWAVLVDGEKAGITPIKNSKVQVDNTKVMVPGRTSMVLGGSLGEKKNPRQSQNQRQ